MDAYSLLHAPDAVNLLHMAAANMWLALSGLVMDI